MNQSEKKLISKEYLTLISGPCAIESEKLALDSAEYLCDLTEKLGINFIYKSSFDKANRSSVSSNRGIGIEKGLKILEKIKTNFKVPILTDVHEYTPLNEVAGVVDILQTPAFLCRQTDFIVNVSSMNKPVNIKKGQFTSPEEMKYVLEKAYSTGNKDIYLCERGYMFGYNNLVSDMRSLVVLKNHGCPVVYDASHSVQRPGAGHGKSSGDSEYILPLSCAATAVGIDALFIEAHPEPEKALSDGDNSLNLNDMEELLRKIIKIDQIQRMEN